MVPIHTTYWCVGRVSRMGVDGADDWRDGGVRQSVIVTNVTDSNPTLIMGKILARTRIGRMGRKVEDWDFLNLPMHQMLNPAWSQTNSDHTWFQWKIVTKIRILPASSLIYISLNWIPTCKFCLVYLHTLIQHNIYSVTSFCYHFFSWPHNNHISNKSGTYILSGFWLWLCYVYHLFIGIKLRILCLWMQAIWYIHADHILHSL